jgi:hypothetical protein
VKNNVLDWEKKKTQKNKNISIESSIVAWSIKEKE